MSFEVLEKLFHSKAEVKIIRLFLNNPEEQFSVNDVAGKSKISLPLAKKEVKNLYDIKFLLLKRKLKKVYYQTNPEFAFLEELKRLIFKTNPTSSERIMSQVSKIGQIRFVAISGTLINSEKGRVDILIVGEHINKNKLKTFLSTMEAEVGKCINYVCMSADEFRYRKGMFDKFVIDILEGPHKVLIDRLKIEI